MSDKKEDLTSDELQEAINLYVETDEFREVCRISTKDLYARLGISTDED